MIGEEQLLGLLKRVVKSFAGGADGTGLYGRQEWTHALHEIGNTPKCR